VTTAEKIDAIQEWIYIVQDLISMIPVCDVCGQDKSRHSESESGWYCQDVKYSGGQKWKAR
jgi:hypothetical protein